jgi:hypothetical protein
MNVYTLIVTASLASQITVLFLLFGSVWLKTRKRFRQHGVTMLIAVVIHTISIFAIMIPSFTVISTVGFPVTIWTLAAVHGAMGTAAEALALWIVVSWRLRTSIQYCAPKKKLMLLTLILWVAALVLGMALYLHFYTPLLPLQ